MRYLLLLIASLLILTGCTMHPPSTAAFMDATERGHKAPLFNAVSSRAEYSHYREEDDGWDMPIALEMLASKNGFTWGFGATPSPYVTLGFGNKYYGVRGWISAPWALGTVMVLCATCLDDDDDDDDKKKDKNDRYDIDLDNLGNLPALWFVTFAGGASIIQQIPLGNHVRVGVEEFIARDVWIPVRDNDEFASAEAGFTVYTNLMFDKWSLALEARHSMLSFDRERDRYSVALTFTYFFSKFLI